MASDAAPRKTAATTPTLPAREGGVSRMHIRTEVTERHTLSVSVANEPGILARIAGLFAGRVGDGDREGVALGDVGAVGHSGAATISRA